MYGTEIWTLQDQDKSSATETEMKFLGNSTAYTQFEPDRNQDILKRIKTKGVLMKISIHNSTWIKHVGGMKSQDCRRLL